MSGSLVIRSVAWDGWKSADQGGIVVEPTAAGEDRFQKMPQIPRLSARNKTPKNSHGSLPWLLRSTASRCGKGGETAPVSGCGSENSRTDAAESWGGTAGSWCPFVESS